MLRQVIGDAVGWGFVVRGHAPCYVQAVDPGSPAAAAGVKVKRHSVLEGLKCKETEIIFQIVLRRNSKLFSSSFLPHNIYQVRQFVCQVNGQCVLYLDYRTVSRLVMTGTRTVVLEVMEPLE